jgi:hypothetical protein
MIEFFLTTAALGSRHGKRLEEGSPVPLVGVPRGLHAAGRDHLLQPGRRWSVVDAFYFSATTLTTVGLGDLTPKTTIGKLFTVVYIFAGLGIILGFIDTVAKETINRQAGRGGSEEGQEDAPAS